MVYLSALLRFTSSSVLPFMSFQRTQPFECRAREIAAAWLGELQTQSSVRMYEFPSCLRIPSSTSLSRWWANPESAAPGVNLTLSLEPLSSTKPSLVNSAFASTSWLTKYQSSSTTSLVIFSTSGLKRGKPRLSRRREPVSNISDRSARIGSVTKGSLPALPLLRW